MEWAAYWYMFPIALGADRLLVGGRTVARHSALGADRGERGGMAFRRHAQAVIFIFIGALTLVVIGQSLLS
jgi:hypothetical protein